MARVDSLGNFLVDVADSIRNKKGTTGAITPANFDTEIAGIETGITPSGTFEITTNGTFDVTNYASATVSIQPNLQYKTATPTTSSQTIKADSGYDGLSSVRVNAIPSNYVNLYKYYEISCNRQFTIIGWSITGTSASSGSARQETVNVGTKVNRNMTPLGPFLISFPTVPTSITSISSSINIIGYINSSGEYFHTPDITAIANPKYLILQSSSTGTVTCEIKTA